MAREFGRGWKRVKIKPERERERKRKRQREGGGMEENKRLENKARERDKKGWKII